MPFEQATQWLRLLGFSDLVLTGTGIEVRHLNSPAPGLAYTLNRAADGWNVSFSVPDSASAAFAAATAAILAEGGATVGLFDFADMPSPELRSLVVRLLTVNRHAILFKGRGNSALIAISRAEDGKIVASWRCDRRGVSHRAGADLLAAIEAEIPKVALRNVLPDARPSRLILVSGEARISLPDTEIPTEAWDRHALRAQLAKHAATLLDHILPVLDRRAEDHRRLDALKADLHAREHQVDRMEHDLLEARHKLQKQERDFTYSRVTDLVGHKLNNPLQTIAVELDTLRLIVARRRKAEGSAADPFVTVEEEIAENLQRAVVSIRDLAKELRDGQLGGEKRFMTAAGLIDCIRAAVPSEVGVASRLSEEEAALPLLVDQRRLREVWEELVGNSRHHARPDRPLAMSFSVTAPSRSDRRHNRFVEIEYRDTGRGIPRTAKPRVFDVSFTTRPEGSGLGLAICRTHIEDHGGLIREDGQPGEGVRFTISLPVARGAPS